MFINNIFTPMQTTQVATYDTCEEAIRRHLHIFEGHYRAGCGYHNFSQLFRNIAVKEFNIKVNELNWKLYDECYDKTFAGSNFTFVYAWLILFKWEDLNKHIDKITNLLFHLCQTN
jgi:hypothetical protein